MIDLTNSVLSLDAIHSLFLAYSNEKPYVEREREREGGCERARERERKRERGREREREREIARK